MQVARRRASLCDADGFENRQCRLLRNHHRKQRVGGSGLFRRLDDLERRGGRRILNGLRVLLGLLAGRFLGFRLCLRLCCIRSRLGDLCGFGDAGDEVGGFLGRQVSTTQHGIAPLVEICRNVGLHRIAEMPCLVAARRRLEACGLERGHDRPDACGLNAQAGVSRGFFAQILQRDGATVAGLMQGAGKDATRDLLRLGVRRVSIHLAGQPIGIGQGFGLVPLGVIRGLVVQEFPRCTGTRYHRRGGVTGDLQQLRLLQQPLGGLLDLSHVVIQGIRGLTGQLQEAAVLVRLLLRRGLFDGPRVVASAPARTGCPRRQDVVLCGVVRRLLFGCRDSISKHAGRHPRGLQCGMRVLDAWDVRALCLWLARRWLRLCNGGRPLGDRLRPALGEMLQRVVVVADLIAFRVFHPRLIAPVLGGAGLDEHRNMLRVARCRGHEIHVFLKSAVARVEPHGHILVKVGFLERVDDGWRCVVSKPRFDHFDGLFLVFVRGLEDVAAGGVLAFNLRKLLLVAAHGLHHVGLRGLGHQ